MCRRDARRKQSADAAARVRRVAVCARSLAADAAQTSVLAVLVVDLSVLVEVGSGVDASADRRERLVAAVDVAAACGGDGGGVLAASVAAAGAGVGAATTTTGVIASVVVVGGASNWTRAKTGGGGGRLRPPPPPPSLPPPLAALGVDVLAPSAVVVVAIAQLTRASATSVSAARASQLIVMCARV